MSESLLKFNNVEFKIQEFEKINIINKDYYLAFYSPNSQHLEIKQSKAKQASVKRGRQTTFLVDEDENPIKRVYINKRKSQKFLQKINRDKEKRIRTLGLKTKECIDERFEQVEGESTPLYKPARNDYGAYDIFCDVYTKEGNVANYIARFEITDGIATVTGEFLGQCFEKNEWYIIPRLIPKEQNGIINMKASKYDPIPILNNSFDITQLHEAKQRTLTFQRKLAEVKHPTHFNLQSPKVFKQMLEVTKGATFCKETQLKELEETARYRLQIINKLKGVSKSVKKVLKKKQREVINKYFKTKEPKKKYQKLSGDTGEYVTTLLFGKRSTRYLSNQRKLDANLNLYSFNYTTPDFLVTINDIPSIVEVKNVQTQALTEQISFELKLAREYELDYVFVCNHYTELQENIAGGNVTKKNKEEIKREEVQNHNAYKRKYKTETENLTKFDERYDWGSRRGFIYHRHFHRSIKTVFKEMYLHHIQGATPNKIIIKRLNLNNAKELEQVFNANQDI